MKLYEINESILALFDQITDPETGEIASNEDELLEQIEGLQMERRSVLEYLAKLVLNNRAEAEALKTEEERLKKRREPLTHKEERLMKILRRECPETTKLGVATLSYRKTTRVDVTDEAAAVEWLKAQKLDCCYKQPEPTVYKDEVKRLMKSGQKVPGCSLVEDQSCSLR